MLLLRVEPQTLKPVAYKSYRARYPASLVFKKKTWTETGTEALLMGFAITNFDIL